MLIEDHEFKFESTTELPNEDDKFWYHDYFYVQSVRLVTADDGYRVEFAIAEPSYVPEDDEYMGYTPEGWEPKTVTFLQSEPVPYEVVEHVEESLLRNEKNAELYTPEIEDGKATYTFCIQF